MLKKEATLIVSENYKPLIVSLKSTVCYFIPRKLTDDYLTYMTFSTSGICRTTAVFVPNMIFIRLSCVPETYKILCVTRKRYELYMIYLVRINCLKFFKFGLV